MMPALPIAAGSKRPLNAFSIDSLMGKDSVAAAASAKANNAAAAAAVAAAAAAAVPGLAYGSFGHSLLKSVYESHYADSMNYAAAAAAAAAAGHHMGVGGPAAAYAAAAAAAAAVMPHGVGHPSAMTAAATPSASQSPLAAQAGSAAFNQAALLGAAQARAADHFLLNPWLLTRHGGAYFGPRFGPADPGLLLQPFRKPKRIRTAFSPSQLLKLEQSFEKNHYVVGQERKELATTLGLSETQVKVWFQNRRTKHKRTKSDGTADSGNDDDKRCDDDEEEESEDYADGDGSSESADGETRGANDVDGHRAGGSGDSCEDCAEAAAASSSIASMAADNVVIGLKRSRFDICCDGSSGRECDSCCHREDDRDVAQSPPPPKRQKTVCGSEVKSEADVSVAVASTPLLRSPSDTYSPMAAAAAAAAADAAADMASP